MTTVQVSVQHESNIQVVWDKALSWLIHDQDGKIMSSKPAFTSFSWIERWMAITGKAAVNTSKTSKTKPYLELYIIKMEKWRAQKQLWPLFSSLELWKFAVHASVQPYSKNHVLYETNPYLELYSIRVEKLRHQKLLWPQFLKSNAVRASAQQLTNMQVIRDKVYLEL